MKIHSEESLKLSHFLLYNETVNIYERFTSQTPDNRSVVVDKPLKINLFYRNEITMILFLWEIWLTNQIESWN